MENTDNATTSSGRLATGHAGNSGLAITFFSDENIPLAKALVGLMREANQEIPSWLSQYAEQPGGRDCKNAFEPEEKNHNYSTRCDAGYGVDSYPNDSSDANNDPTFASGHSDANSGSNEGERRHMGNDVPTLATLVALNRANNQGAAAGSTLGHKIAWFGKRDV
ncbi:hypothetical protein VNO77_08374 [Canavalia gladiata]|uniref:Uncharacterized protein n=1 Tax=Canavalia gladiata TaxID=3824 RepID=A0AAN9M962_CANGL